MLHMRECMTTAAFNAETPEAVLDLQNLAVGERSYKYPNPHNYGFRKVRVTSRDRCNALLHHWLSFSAFENEQKHRGGSVVNRLTIIYTMISFI